MGTSDDVAADDFVSEEGVQSSRNIEMASMDDETAESEPFASTPVNLSIESDDVGEIARKLVNAAMEKVGEDELPNEGTIVPQTSANESEEDLGEISRNIVNKAIHSINEDIVDAEIFREPSHDENADAGGIDGRHVDSEMGNADDGSGRVEVFSHTSSDSNDVAVIARNILITASNASDDENTAESLTPNTSGEGEDLEEIAETQRLSERLRIQRLSNDIDDASLCSAEIEELDDLLDKNESGISINEDRLYDLDLYDRWQNGETLNKEETKDLENFKARRRDARSGSNVDTYSHLDDLRHPKDNLDEDRMSPRSDTSESEVVAEEALSTDDQLVAEEAPSPETLGYTVGDESSLSSWELGKLLILNGN